MWRWRLNLKWNMRCVNFSICRCARGHKRSLQALALSVFRSAQCVELLTVPRPSMDNRYVTQDRRQRHLSGSPCDSGSTLQKRNVFAVPLREPRSLFLGQGVEAGTVCVARNQMIASDRSLDSCALCHGLHRRGPIGPFVAIQTESFEELRSDEVAHSRYHRIAFE